MPLRLLATIVGWLAVSAFLGFIAWTTVHVIIDDVGGGQPTMLSPAEVTGLLPAAASGQGATPSVTLSPGSTPTPAITPTPSLTSSPVPRRTTSGSTNGRTASPRPSKANGSASARPPNPARTGTASVARTATFAITGGTVAVTCRANAISLNYARPNDGWRVDVGNRGPEEVEVAFRSTRSGLSSRPMDSGSEGEIQLKCSSGVPVRR